MNLYFGIRKKSLAVLPPPPHWPWRSGGHLWVDSHLCHSTSLSLAKDSGTTPQPFSTCVAICDSVPRLMLSNNCWGHRTRWEEEEQISSLNPVYTAQILKIPLLPQFLVTFLSDQYLIFSSEQNSYTFFWHKCNILGALTISRGGRMFSLPLLISNCLPSFSSRQSSGWECPPGPPVSPNIECGW